MLKKLKKRKVAYPLIGDLQKTCYFSLDGIVYYLDEEKIYNTDQVCKRMDNFDSSICKTTEENTSLSLKEKYYSLGPIIKMVIVDKITKEEHIIPWYNIQ